MSLSSIVTCAVPDGKVPAWGGAAGGGDEHAPIPTTISPDPSPAANRFHTSPPRFIWARHVGEQLGAGKPIDEIIASMNQGAEGVKAASVVMEFADSYGIATPIAREVDGVINHGATPEGAYRGLAAEKPGHEVHGAGF
jgi:NAD-dependent glycerol-3-phosphate dehydrogenase C-terminus